MSANTDAYNEKVERDNRAVDKYNYQADYGDKAGLVFYYIARFRFIIGVALGSLYTSLQYTIQ